MVKRICILYGDASLMLFSNQSGENAAMAQARTECAIVNKGERDPRRKALIGEIEIDLNSFRERC